MNVAETSQIMDILAAAYPKFYSGNDAPNPEAVLSLWASMFAEDDFMIVAAAVKALIAGDAKGFPPVIGQVKARIRQITKPQEMTEGEAWALVAKAIRNSAYDSLKEFDALPGDIQRIVGAPSQLRDWGTMDSDTVHSVVASNFQRAYRVKAEQKKNYEALPGDVKAMIGEVSKKFELEAHDEI
ncbi:Loader and inhibitor of phage G40P [anaerobic digester metagenome]